MKISEKEAVSPVIGVILMVAITVVLAAVLYVWVSSMTPTGGGTPYCTLSASTAGTESGYTQANVTWMVSAPSRADIKWADVSARILDDGAAVAATGLVSWTNTTSSNYVTGGDTIKVTLLRSVVTTGSIMKLIMVYVPSGGTFAESSTTLSYTA